MMDAEWSGHWVAPFMPMLLIALPFAIGNYFLAQRLDRQPWLWALLTLIPIVNYLFMLYVGYMVVYAVLDRLPAARGPSPGNPA